MNPINAIGQGYQWLDGEGAQGVDWLKGELAKLGGLFGGAPGQQGAPGGDFQLPSPQQSDTGAGPAAAAAPPQTGPFADSLTDTPPATAIPVRATQDKAIADARAQASADPALQANRGDVPMLPGAVDGSGNGQVPQVAARAQAMSGPNIAGVPIDPNTGYAKPNWLRVVGDVLGGQSIPRAIDYESRRPIQAAMQSRDLQVQEAMREQQIANYKQMVAYRASLPDNLKIAFDTDPKKFMEPQKNASGEVTSVAGSPMSSAPLVQAAGTTSVDPVTHMPLYTAPEPEKVAPGEDTRTFGGTVYGPDGRPVSGPTAAAPSAAPPPGQFDLTPNVIKAIAGEAAGEGVVGRQAVLGVMMNRAKASGQSLEQVATASHQFSGLTSHFGQSVTPGSNIYQSVLNDVSPLAAGKINNPAGTADHFYAPGLMPTPPKWAAGQQSQDIGRHRFYTLGYGGPADSKYVSLPGGAQPPTTAQPGAQGQGGQAAPPLWSGASGGAKPLYKPLVDPQDRQAAGISPTDHANYTLNLATNKAEKVGDAPFGNQQLLELHKGFFDSDEYKKFQEGATAYNGWLGTLGHITDNNGVLNMAAMDSYLKSINPGLGVRNATVNTLMDHMGFPQEVQSKIQSAVGNGFLTPQTLQIMTQIMHDYTQSHYNTLVSRRKGDIAMIARYGLGQDDLGETFDPVPDTPKIGFQNQPVRPGSAPPGYPAGSAPRLARVPTKAAPQMRRYNPQTGRLEPVQ